MQITVWVRFRVEVEGEDEDIIRVNKVNKAFNSWMTEVFLGSDLHEIMEEMIAYMRTKVENLMLANSRFMFNQVLFLGVNFHRFNLTRGSSYLRLPD